MPPERFDPVLELQVRALPNGQFSIGWTILPGVAVGFGVIDTERVGEEDVVTRTRAELGVALGTFLHRLALPPDHERYLASKLFGD